MVSSPSPGRQAFRPVLLRRSLLLLGLACVASGLAGGLERLGVTSSAGLATASIHGPLVVLGGFCTVIGLERALAVRSTSALAAPALAALGALLLVLRASAAPWVLVSATLGLCSINAVLLRRSPAVFSWLMFFGGAVLAVGAMAWALGSPVSVVSFSWMAFFVITIVAERLELSRLSPLPPWASLVVSVSCQALGYFSLAPILGANFFDRSFGIALFSIGLWQLRFDLARRTVRKVGLPKYVAICVFGAASWLVIVGTLVSAFGLRTAGPWYDAVLHGVFIGYALSMVFAHAPIILPVVAGVRIGFSNYLYVPACLLQLGLALRVVGDLLGNMLSRQLGGILTAVSLVVYGLTVALCRSRREGETTAPTSEATSTGPS